MGPNGVNIAQDIPKIAPQSAPLERPGIALAPVGWRLGTLWGCLGASWEALGGLDQYLQTTSKNNNFHIFFNVFRGSRVSSGSLLKLLGAISQPFGVC